MNIRELISEWKKDFSWVNDIPNFFLKKEVYILPSPIREGEVVIYLSIIDNTLFVNEKLEPFYSYMTFAAMGLTDATLNKSGDAIRLKLKSELEDFTNRAKLEREAQIKEWEGKGLKIKTSNPLMWKDI